MAIYGEQGMDTIGTKKETMAKVVDSHFRQQTQVYNTYSGTTVHSKIITRRETGIVRAQRIVLHFTSSPRERAHHNMITVQIQFSLSAQGG